MTPNEVVALRALPTPDWNQWNDWLSLIRDVLPVSTTRPEVLAAWDAFDHLRTAFRRAEMDGLPGRDLLQAAEIHLAGLDQADRNRSRAVSFQTWGAVMRGADDLRRAVKEFKAELEGEGK